MQVAATCPPRTYPRPSWLAPPAILEVRLRGGIRRPRAQNRRRGGRGGARPYRIIEIEPWVRTPRRGVPESLASNADGQLDEPQGKRAGNFRRDAQAPARASPELEIRILKPGRPLAMQVAATSIRSGLPSFERRWSIEPALPRRSGKRGALARRRRARG